ncbi:uncharacterized protein LOC141899336 [Tubulanus polymorphus]|uniref:uncharacterized protein LOC141899336 n=1 Tax=Tubulanus polymorphus TaxID=672921 RepID=UPI003DA5D053
MVLALTELCLNCIAGNLNRLNRAGRYLAPIHKEILLERLVSHDMLTSDYLPNVTYNLFSSNLKRVKFYKCHQVTDTLLKHLSNSGCKLTSLMIHRCEQVTDSGILSVTLNQDELVSVELRKLPSLTNRGLNELKSQHLKLLDLRGCNNVSSDAVKNVVFNNPSICHLNIIGCNKLNNSVFTSIAMTLNSRLESIHVTNLHCVNDESLSAIAEHCHNLKYLEMLGCNRVTHESMEKLFQRCTKLEFLDISYCSLLQKSPSCNVLKMIPMSVSSLSFCGLLLEDPELLIDSLKRLTKLKTLRLCGVTALNEKTMKEILKEIGQDLTCLDLSGCMDLTDEALKSVSKYCTSLEQLAIHHVMAATGTTLLPMFQDAERAANINSLQLSCRQFSIDVLFTIAQNCHNIEKLSISGLTDVTEELILMIAENCPKLIDIGLKGCKQVTDKAICLLARNCPIQKIVISGIHSLTDKCIFALANSCHYLDSIYVSGCSLVSPVALRYLTDCCIPRVYISHQVPNAAPNQLMAKNLDTGEFCRADLL